MTPAEAKKDNGGENDADKGNASPTRTMAEIDKANKQDAERLKKEAEGGQ